MVSFRRDQFQALLIALVIADAVSHGYLPGPGLVPIATIKTTVHPVPSRSALVGNRGCHLLADTLNHLIAQVEGALVEPSAPPTLDVVIAQLPALSGVEAILAGLPWLLPWVDSLPPTAAAGWGDDLSAFGPALRAFYPLLQSVWQQQSGGGRLAEGASDAVSTAVGETVDVSLVAAIVGAAAGDFELTLGQSLYHPAAFPGIALLSSLLSAAGGGLPIIPTAHYQSLCCPTLHLQDWLEQRWHISTLKAVEVWAEVLWQQWLGNYRWRSPQGMRWGGPPVQALA